MPSGYCQIRKALGIKDRVSDNAFSLVLRRLEPDDLRLALIRQVKAEHQRKTLRPCFDALPWSTVAIDGKHLATLGEKDLRNLVSAETPLDGGALDIEQLERVIKSRFEYVQFRKHNDARVDGLIRVELVTLDAGNSSLESAKSVRKHGAHYFMALKGGQGALHTLAQHHLGEASGQRPLFSTSVEQRGKTICYSVWVHELDEGHGWQDARQLVRVERVAAGDEDDEPEVGNRYYVCSKGAAELSAEHALILARHHWRCENESHWTSDAIFDEDARRTPWTRHPTGILVVSLLRCIATNILAVLRALSRIQTGDKLIKPSWKTCIEQALMTLFEPLLDMEEFNACEC